MSTVFSSSSSSVRDFVALLKPRVMSLVVFTGVAGMVLAPGEIHPLIAILAIACIALGSGAAGAINMWYDRDIDAVMLRTQRRPIPAGRVEGQVALEFAVVMAAVSVFVMSVLVNYVAGGLLLLAILFYVFVYTVWLKRRTPQNIVIGGAAGAFPPMIGWAAVTGNLALEPIVLFLIIFLWTPPHFWALALYRSDDYARAHIPMLSVTHGREFTIHQMLLYTIVLVVVSLVPWFLGMHGLVYGVPALLLGVRFLWLNLLLWRGYEERVAKQMFGFSILYLFALFSALMLDRVWTTIF